jgi:two-component system nitrate/nitrite response regulator NarL
MPTNKKSVPLKKIKVLIVDDHQMVRDGIRSMLDSKVENYNFVVTEASSGEDAVAKSQKYDYDIILMDYQLPVLNGAETVYKILIYKPESKILALSNYDEYSYVKNIIDAGAKGYVLKNIGPSELIKAIETILSGKNYFTNDVAVKLINVNENRALKFGKNHITKREIEVLKLIAKELSNKEIASRLKIEKRTVDSHRQSLLKKFKAKNGISLVKLAYEFKLI